MLVPLLFDYMKIGQLVFITTSWMINDSLIVLHYQIASLLIILCPNMLQINEIRLVILKSTSISSYPCSTTWNWYTVCIAKLLLLIVYLFLVLLVFNFFLMLKLLLYYFRISQMCFFFSLHCLERPAGKHFTVSLHLFFMKHVANTIVFDLSGPSQLQQWEV